MKATVHKFTGDWNRVFSWEGARSRVYKKNDQNQVTETWMIGKKEGAENFAFRYYELTPGSRSKKETHNHDHGILVIQGNGEVLLDQRYVPISQGDIIYIPPDTQHELVNSGGRPLGFLCVIPARRKKGDKMAWAEEGINFDGD